MSTVIDVTKSRVAATGTHEVGIDREGWPAGPLPTRADLALWDEPGGPCENAYELVSGVPTMPPTEGALNRGAGMMLAMALNRHRKGWLAVEELEVTLEVGAEPTVRRPDLLVALSETYRRTEIPTRRIAAEQALFVAEIVSDSSIERDHVTKRAEYARAGIPAYLVVDMRPEPGEFWLYEERDAAGEFVDVEPARRVTLTVAGARIPLDVGDLIP